jgi:UDP-4-amino-4,6-dideoxy-N-acetyl-beta-L-altrosamine transaminase
LSAPFIPYGRQDVRAEDVEAVAAVLKSDWLTQGPAGPAFEEAVAQYCGAAHAVATCNATAALHVACLALGLGPGDWLWTSPNTFVASANCALYCGAGVDFVDIDPQTYNMSVPALEAKLESAAAAGRLPKVVMPVHFAGQSCDMRAIHALAKQYGFRVLEDASHAIGGTYLGKPVGGCLYSDITVFSFHPVKIITTGEGGMALTNDAGLAARMERLRSHGVTRSEADMDRESEGPWYYQQVELGFNYRMTDIQAALGLSQLGRVGENIARRGAIARRYDESLGGLPLVTPARSGFAASAWHLYVVQVEDGGERKRVFEALRAAGIGVNVHYIPVHTQPYYRKFGFGVGDFPEAEKYYARAITLPMYPALEDSRQDEVVAAMKGALA